MTPSQPVVLVIEDEAIIALDLQVALETAGFEVHLFSTAADAVGWLDANAANAAILDIRLPDGDSSLAASLLAEAGIPFIVHSGELQSAHHGTAYAQAHQWISKPAAGIEIVRACQAMLARRN